MQNILYLSQLSEIKKYIVYTIVVYVSYLLCYYFEHFVYSWGTNRKYLDVIIQDCKSLKHHIFIQS